MKQGFTVSFIATTTQEKTAEEVEELLKKILMRSPSTYNSITFSVGTIQAVQVYP